MFKIIPKMTNRFRAASPAKGWARYGQALLPASAAMALLGGVVVVPGAKALTVTYGATSADYVPTPNTLINTRPLQLSWTGTAINNPRNFIYSGLAPSPLAGRWIPLNQAGPNPKDFSKKYLLFLFSKVQNLKNFLFGY